MDNQINILKPVADKLSGKFIVLDGPDGAGKSTQIELLAKDLKTCGQTVTVAQDPGGTAIGSRIREILLDRKASEMSVRCELMLYMASRAQLADELLRPALKKGHCVLCDRYVSSTIAYQGAGGADADVIRRLADDATGSLWPDFTIILDLESVYSLSRVGDNPDRVELKGSEYHKRVRENFLALAEANQGNYSVVGANGTIEEVHSRIVEAVSGHFKS